MLGLFRCILAPVALLAIATPQVLIGLARQAAAVQCVLSEDQDCMLLVILTWSDINGWCFTTKLGGYQTLLQRHQSAFV